MTRPSLAARADALVRELADGEISASAYTTAWVARLRDASGQLVFPESADWLRQNQRPDGSWGGALGLPHDRLVCTLSAVVALTGVDAPWAAPSAQRGVAYLHAHAGAWQESPHETMGFELIVPALAAAARERGLAIPEDDSGRLRANQAEKLRLIPLDTIAHHTTTLLFTAEVLDVIDWRATAQRAGPDGSLLGAPASTAVLWSKTAEAAAMRYLRETAGQFPTGGFPDLHPIENFETSWVLYHLQRARLLPPAAKSHLDLLHHQLKAHGAIGSGAKFPLPDPDCTAMAVNLLHSAARDVTQHREELLAFERDQHFAVYPHERDPSVTPNARALEAFTAQPDRYAPQIEKILAFLLASRRDGTWWSDKWHVSPYYATAHVVFALQLATPQHLAPTRRWLLETQNANGSWGTSDGNPEEAAYAALALDAIRGATGEPLPPTVMPRAQEYLAAHLDADAFDERWVAKCLYDLPKVTRSAILAACAVTGRA
jgi:halimadienyl-diphosphate synthase